MMVADRLADFIATRVPPYKVGECFTVDANRLLRVKVLENHILAGYSEVEVSIVILTEKAKVSFQELRATPTKQVECQ
jgi:hypothetical protein